MRILPRIIADFYRNFWESLFRLIQRRTIIGFGMIVSIVVASISLGLAFAEHVIASEALWRVIVYLMSGSDTVQPVTSVGRSIATLALVCGVLLQAVVTGYIAAAFGRLFLSSQSIRLKPSWRVFENHIIMLGWGPKRKEFLSQLNTAWKDGQEDPREIVIISPDPHLDRGEEDIYNHVWHVRGEQTNTETLREADLTPHRGKGAELCLIMGKFKFTPEENDRRNLLQLFAVEHLHPDVYSLAEVQIEDNHDLFVSANADQIIMPGNYVDLLFARTVEFRGVASWADELLSLAPVTVETGGKRKKQQELDPVSFYIRTAGQIRVTGKTIAEAIIDFQVRTRSIIAGIVGENGVTFFPDISPPDTLLKATDALLIIARPLELR